MPDTHIVDRYIKTIGPFIDKTDGEGLDYFIPEMDNYNLEIEGDFVVLVIGANHFTKQLPNSKFVELCNLIHKPIVLLGGKADTEKASAITTSTNKEIVNLVGELTINQSASVIQKADWVVTPDTGLMHIAAAFKRKIVSYWGNTVPEFGMTPYKPNPVSVLFEQNGLKCRPCSKIGFKECPKKHFDCMNKHNVKKMADWVNN